VEKYGTAGQATDENIMRRMRYACWVKKKGYKLTLRIFNSCFFFFATIFILIKIHLIIVTTEKQQVLQILSVSL
jgi:hypothetical protein